MSWKMYVFLVIVTLTLTMGVVFFPPVLKANTIGSPVVKAEEVTEKIYAIEESKLSALEDGPDGNIIPKDLFADANLYNALVSFFYTIEGKPLDQDGKRQLWTKMFDNHDISSLRLQNQKITSLADLRWFECEKITEVNLSFNKIAGEVDLTIFPKLEKVALTGNNISGVKIEGLQALDVLFINDNNIKSIDLSEFTGSYVDVSVNALSTFADVVLPEESVTRLDVVLLSNNITDASEEELVGLTEKNILVDLGLQGIKQDITKGASVAFYNFVRDNISVVLSSSSLDEDIVMSVNDDYKTLVQLEPGNYTVSYRYIDDAATKVYVGSAALTDLTIDGKWKVSYKDNSLKVLPVAPTVAFIVDGKSVEKLTNVTNNTKVVISSEQGVCYVSIGNTSNWQLVTEAILLEQKVQTIYVKVVVNDVDSEIVSFITPYHKEPMASWLLIILILLFVAFFIGGLFLVKIFVLDRPNRQE